MWLDIVSITQSNVNLMSPGECLRTFDASLPSCNMLSEKIRNTGEQIDVFTRSQRRELCQVSSDRLHSNLFQALHLLAGQCKHLMRSLLLLRKDRGDITTHTVSGC